VVPEAIPEPETTLPTAIADVDETEVTLVLPEVKVPVMPLVLNVSATELPELVAAMLNVTELVDTEVTVVPETIPVPETESPAEIDKVDVTVTMVLPDVTVPVVLELNVRATDVPTLVVAVLRPMELPEELTDETVVPEAIPVPETESPTEIEDVKDVTEAVTEVLPKAKVPADVIVVVEAAVVAELKVTVLVSLLTAVTIVDEGEVAIPEPVIVLPI